MAQEFFDRTTVYSTGVGDDLPMITDKIDNNTNELYLLSSIDGSDSTLGATDSDRLEAAFDSTANPNEKTVLLPEGEYVLGIDFSMDTVESINLKGVPGKTIIKYDNDAVGLILRAPFSAEFTVTAVDMVLVGSADTQDDEVTRLTVTGDLSIFAEKDICKIYSEDVSVYGVTAADKNRIGELFKVRSVDVGGGFIYTSGKLYEQDKYLTGVKVRKLENRHVTISDIIFEINGTQTELYDDTLAARESALQLWGITNLKLNNVHLKSAWGQGVNLIGCWEFDVTVTTDQLINGSDSNWSTLSALGYGVTAMTCFGGHVKMPRAEGCRHAFTTVHPKDTSYNSSRWLEYGDTIGTRVSGTAIASVGSPWDTHESGIGLIFDSCYSINPQRGDHGNIRSIGITSRSRHPVYNNPKIMAGATAIHVIDISHGEVNTITINNPDVSKSYSTSGAAILIEGAADGNTIATISNLTANKNFRVLDVIGAKVIVNGGVIGIDGDWFARVKGSGELIVCGTPVIDYTNAAGSEHCIRLGDDATASVVGAHIAGDANCASLFYSEDGTGTKVAKYINVTSDTGTFNPNTILGTTPPTVIKMPLL